MSKRIFLPLLIAAGVLVSGAASAEVRIASIQSARLIKESPQYQQMESEMRADFEARAKRLERDGKKLAEDLQKFQRDRDVMSASERSRTEKDLNTRRIDFNYSEKTFREDVARKERELGQKLMAQISEVIEKAAKDGRYDLVVQDPVYAGKSVDITDDILKVLARRR